MFILLIFCVPCHFDNALELKKNMVWRKFALALIIIAQMASLQVTYSATTQRQFACLVLTSQQRDTHYCENTAWITDRSAHSEVIVVLNCKSLLNVCWTVILRNREVRLNLWKYSMDSLGMHLSSKITPFGVTSLFSFLIFLFFSIFQTVIPSSHFHEALGLMYTKIWLFDRMGIGK